MSGAELGQSTALEPGVTPDLASAVATSRRGGTGVPRGTRARRRFLLLAGFGYLTLSVVIWWHIWSSDPASSTTCGCGDPALFLWFLEWPAYAIAHGLDPFYSSAMLHPRGVNLLSNTSVLALGVPLAPVTWIFGPVATMNVAATLAPALSALSMSWLLCRWVRWRPAAFFGGLLYGFSPFVLVALAGSYLMQSWLCIPPLIVGCLDELLVRQRSRPGRVGLALALLLTIEFFLSTEVLAMLVVVGAIALVALGGAALVRDRQAVRRRMPHAARGFLVAGAVTAALLAFPVWFALDGPAHLSGPIWQAPLAAGGNGLARFWQLGYAPSSSVNIARHFGGYQGRALPWPNALGLGVIGVVVAGWIAFRQDGKLTLFGVVGIVAVALSIGIAPSHWTPWRLFDRLPEMENVIPSRFSVFVNLCAAAMLGLVLDHCRHVVEDVPGDRVARRDRPVRPGGPVKRRFAPGSVARWRGALVATGAAALALVPLASLEATNLPLTVRPVSLPAWFSTGALRLRAGQVLLTYPDTEPALAWQSVDRMSFAMVGGGGPAAVARRAGRQRRAVALLANASTGLGVAVAANPANTTTLRDALAAWGVTMVVVPDGGALPGDDGARSPSYAAALFTATLGRLPARQHRALVWDGLSANLRRSATHPLPGQAFARCIGESRAFAAARCVLNAHASAPGSAEGGPGSAEGGPGSAEGGPGLAEGTA